MYLALYIIHIYIFTYIYVFYPKQLTLHFKVHITLNCLVVGFDIDHYDNHLTV